MAWSTPKTDWNGETVDGVYIGDRFNAVDFNRIKNNLEYLRELAIKMYEEFSMLESGTDLYEEFQTYFTTQKQLFESAGDKVIENVRALTNAEYDSYVTYVADLKERGDSSLAEIEQTYEEHMTSYESEQKKAFDTWFDTIKGQLSEDVAGSLQNQTTELDERLSALEHMVLKNDFTAPLTVDNSGTLLVDDLGFAIVADWKYKEV